MVLSIGKELIPILINLYYHSTKWHSIFYFLYSGYSIYYLSAFLPRRMILLIYWVFLTLRDTVPLQRCSGLNGTIGEKKNGSFALQFHLKFCIAVWLIFCFWYCRGMSSVHAIFITVMSVYLVFFSDLFSDNRPDGLIITRSSNLSTFALGVTTILFHGISYFLFI